MRVLEDKGSRIRQVLNLGRIYRLTLFPEVAIAKSSPSLFSTKEAKMQTGMVRDIGSWYRDLSFLIEKRGCT
jgi:hypothetical protein